MQLFELSVHGLTSWFGIIVDFVCNKFVFFFFFFCFVYFSSPLIFLFFLSFCLSVFLFSFFFFSVLFCFETCFLDKLVGAETQKVELRFKDDY